MSVATRLSRVTVGLVTLGATLAASPAEAAESPEWSRLDASVATSVNSILATATAGLPLKVVITSTSASGPSIATVTASSATEALGVIAKAQSAPATIAVGMAQPVQISAATNDPFWGRQWAMRALKAPAAWKKSIGTGVVVAVIDTGVRTQHPELAGRVLPGVDFVDPGTSVKDEHGHGTHVAGIIAAARNNARGIAGLAPGASILPVRVLDEDGSGDTAGVANGVIWAANHGADVINMSLGTTSNDAALRSAIAYAISKNIVVVAAAGNEGCGLLGSPRSYPAAFNGVVGVSAINSDRSIASYSNCGSYVDVAAPGTGIWSTMIVNSNPGLGCKPKANYCKLSGTSMATPYVAASAALSISRMGAGWSATTVSNLVKSTAEDLGSPGKDSRFGAGLIRPLRLVNRS